MACILAAAVGVDDQPPAGTAVGDGHLKGLNDQFPGQIFLHRITCNPFRIEVNNRRQVQPGFIGIDIRDIRYPSPIGAISGKLPISDVFGHR